jgi:hypothetical protein
MRSSSGRRSNPTILPRPDGRVRTDGSHRRRGTIYRCRTMLQIKLAHRKRARRDDPMGRDWIGDDPTVPVEEIFARNRGVWKLGPRADLETHAMFAYTGDRKIKFVAEIDALELSATGARSSVECSTLTIRCLGDGSDVPCTATTRTRFTTCPATDGSTCTPIGVRSSCLVHAYAAAIPSPALAGARHSRTT